MEIKFENSDIWQDLQKLNKKIVFYHTVYSDHIGDKEQYLDNLEGVLKGFREKEDVVVCWNAEIDEGVSISADNDYLRYHTIVDAFQREKWGVWVDKCNKKKAMTVADAYYGDETLEALLFAVKEKTAVLQKYNDTCCLMVETALDDGDCIWITAGAYVYGLFRVWKENWKVEYMGTPNKKKSSTWNYSTIIKCNNRLYLIPYFEDYMGIYDIETRKWDRVLIQELSEEYLEYRGRKKFSGAYEYKNYIYLMPAQYPTIARYNKETNEIEYLYESMELLVGKVKNYTYAFSNQSFLFSQYIIFYSRKMCRVIRFDMELCKFEILYDASQEAAYDLMEYDGVYFWLIPSNQQKPILKFKDFSEEPEVIRFTVDKIRFRRTPFIGSCIADGFIWLLPGLADGTLKIDTKTNKVTVSDELLPENINFDQSVEQWKYMFVKLYENTLYTFDGTTGKFVTYDFAAKEKKEGYLTVQGYEKGYLEACKFVDNLMNGHLWDYFGDKCIGPEGQEEVRFEYK